MSKAQILEELPRLTVSDRSQLLPGSLNFTKPTCWTVVHPRPPNDRRSTRRSLNFERDPSPGEPWRDVFRQIRESRR